MDDIIRSQLRLPQSLHEALKACAEGSGRSLNAEIVYRLSKSVSEAEFVIGAGSDARTLEERLAEKLAQPENRVELEGLIKTINGLLAPKS